MSQHRAGGSAHRIKAPLTTGRLALWLGFWFLMACMVLGAAVNLAGKGPS